MVTRKRGEGYEYDFRLLGKRWRKGRFRTKAEATAAEKLKREELLTGKVRKTFREAYDDYVVGLKRRSRAATTLEHYQTFYDRTLGPALGHLYLTEVSTSVINAMKQKMPTSWGPKSVNQRLILLRAVMRFAWEMEWIPYPPKVPMEKVPKRPVEWHEVDERDEFLQAIFDMHPQWYFFFYLSARLGLRRGEVYPIEHSQFVVDKMQLVIDKAVVVGVKGRPAYVRHARKGGDSLVLEITQDIVDAYKWHCQQGYAGKRLVFNVNDTIPNTLDSHEWPMNDVYKKTGLRRLTHHKLGRHSVGSQADSIGATTKAIQRQLGHKSPKSTDQYVHGSSKAQRAIVEALRPTRAPHEPTPTKDLN